MILRQDCIVTGDCITWAPLRRYRKSSWSTSTIIFPDNKSKVPLLVLTALTICFENFSVLINLFVSYANTRWQSSRRLVNHFEVTISTWEFVSTENAVIGTSIIERLCKELASLNRTSCYPEGSLSVFVVLLNTYRLNKSHPFHQELYHMISILSYTLSANEKILYFTESCARFG